MPIDLSVSYEATHPTPYTFELWVVVPTYVPGTRPFRYKLGEGWVDSGGNARDRRTTRRQLRRAVQRHVADLPTCLPAGDDVITALERVA